MSPGSFRFEDFQLDPRDRLLRRDGAPVELNSRYLDALALLVREQGKLVSKDRFLEEVWRGVPVTDEALTQCIKTLRSRLGDKAANPRFIETVPKHGYRFIAPVDWLADEPAPAPVASATPAPQAASSHAWPDLLLLAGAGVIGAGLAGASGGLVYAFAGSSQPLEPGMGAVSVLLVLVCLTILVGVVGGAGVSLGIAASALLSRRIGPWSVLGGAAGGLIVGAFVKLLGLDAFNLLFGQSPGEITGGPEGAVLGAAVGFGVWQAGLTGAPRLRRALAAGALAGGLAGVVITLLGGRLMAGSLDLLARRFPDSRLNLDQLGGLFGETGFGPVSRVVIGGVEGLLFVSFTVVAITLARRGLGENRGG